MKSEVVREESFWKNDLSREDFENFVPKGFIATQIHVLCADFVKFGRPDRCNCALLTSQNRQALTLSLLRGSRPKFVRTSSRQYTVCTRVHVDPHISRPSFLAVKKMSKIQDPRISRPLVYRLVSDMADAINSVPRDAAVRKVRVFCDEINR